MPSRRRLARPGLTYVEANGGRLVTETAELLDIKAEIRKRWPDLDVYWDRETREFVVVQRVEEDGTTVEKFVLARPYCGDKLMDEIAQGDPTSPHWVDPAEAVDKYNEGVERDRDRALADISGDFGERLIHALKADGFYNHENIEKAPRPHLARRSINAGIRD